MSATGENLPSPLIAARRIVVKVGSALLVDQETGQLRRAWLTGLVEDLLRLRARGQQVILVSSGAIALGRRELGLAPGALRLDESQAEQTPPLAKQILAAGADVHSHNPAARPCAPAVNSQQTPSPRHTAIALQRCLEGYGVAPCVKGYNPRAPSLSEPNNRGGPAPCLTPIRRV